MASRIAGITVEIGGDTTKLSKALESVNKTIKTTQSELKDVNKLLKLDPSNTETVTQKQRMLKDAIEATKEKLTTLKTAAEQANQQLADGKITQDQYDALQREIVETEQNLKSLQEQAAVTNTTLAKIDAVGEKLQTVGSQVEGVGKKFLPVTAAVTGLGTAAVKTAADFDQEMSKVSAISGATGDDFDQLRAKAREMGAKTKFSASEAASAMEYMAMAGWKTGDMLDGIEGIMNLAAASGEDLATTSDIVTDALTAFGLSASDSGHFADILAAASSNANTNVSMIGETFKYTGLLDSLLRQGVKNSSVVLERLRQAGFEGGATIVKEYIAAHKHLIPAKRQLVAAQGNRGRRYVTKPGEAYQMDWGFTDVLDYNGQTYRVACFAMICHHCGQRYIEFFPNARQENLFIGMIHAFQYMGVPRFVLTDNMKSVVLHRDLDGHPVWQKDYEAFMQTLTFETKLCKPRHPFTKGKVERLVRFVKDNFLADRVFCDFTDLNWQALEWCNKQNGTYRRTVDGAPQKIHETICGEQLRMVSWQSFCMCHRGCRFRAMRCRWFSGRVSLKLRRCRWGFSA